ncbi:MAG: RluA family pseudouridine synthase [Betaproteobacteria bacterium]|nr:MAG: RluA family pseudouridine synthase [Betaproteobacteria bacterium]
MNGLSKDVVNHLAVDEAGEGQRVDNFLLRVLKGVPKSHIYREDEHLLVVDKPAGVVVHPARGHSAGTLAQALAGRAAGGEEPWRAGIVHRLDRDTSGVLLVAKRRAALLALHATLREGHADKRYLVLVKGRWRDAKRRVELPLAKFMTGGGERQVRVEHASGRMARTVFYRRRIWAEATPPLSLLEAELATGRTHQIRVHLTHLGFPLAGDDKYGDFAWNRALAKQSLKRMFLHAWRLSLPHPTEKRVLTVESPLPPDLAEFVARLDEAQHRDGDGDG